MILVSACLVGENCKYNGGNNKNQDVIEFLKGKDYIAFCPEKATGLLIPREPAEIRMLCGLPMVVMRDGWDVTPEFVRAAEMTLNLAVENDVDLAIMKENSPSCGVHYIYDGSFSGEKINGNGMSTGYLMDYGIKVINEDEVKDIIDK